jgi:hypothetical protein
MMPDSIYSFFPNDSEKYAKLRLYTSGMNFSEENPNLDELDSLTIKLIKCNRFPDGFFPYFSVEVYENDNYKDLQNLMDIYKDNSLLNVYSQDANYFFLESTWFLKHRNEYDTSYLKKMYSINEKKLLTLNFRELFKNIPFQCDTLTICGLPPEYEIIILKSGNNFVLPPSTYYNWDILPESIKHGYRGGVAFKYGEPYIIYWVVAW